MGLNQGWMRARGAGRRWRWPLLRRRLWHLPLLLGLGLSLLLGQPAAAFLAMPGGSSSSNAAAGEESLLQRNTAFSCGRLWCSTVVFRHDVINLITLAIEPEEGMSDRAAARAVERRAATVERSVKEVILQVRTTLQGDSTSLSAEQQQAAAAIRERAAPTFWSVLNRQSLHPLTPTVAVGFRNNVPVVFVPASPELGLGPSTLVTVTEPDAAHAGSTELELAEQWKTALQKVISESLWGVEFNRRFPAGRLLLTSAVAGVVVTLLLGLAVIRSELLRALRRLRASSEALRDSAKREVMAAYSGSLEPSGVAPPPDATPDAAAGEAGADASPEAEHSGPPPARRQRRRGWLERLGRRAGRQPQLLIEGTGRLFDSLSIPSLRQQGWRNQARNLLEMALLITGLLQLSLLAGGIGAIAIFYPNTRIGSLLLMQRSVSVPLMWLALIVVRWVLLLAIDHSVNSWTIESTIRNPSSRRYALQAVTYTKMLRNLATIVCIGIGIVLTLVIAGINQSMLTGAGVLAVGAGLLLRNILDDFMQGLLIILTDRFAIGDVVTIPPHSGFVENMNLFNTQLRGIDGQLTSLPNGQIRAVENLTKDWSRVNFLVEVAADEDLRAVLDLIRRVAEGMRHDPDWADSILGTPEVLGVDELRQSGCLIRVWIQTLPLAQWPVGREFRLRVKEAFDREGIRLGLPRQEVLMQGTPASAAGGLPLPRP
ncbi:MAG: mechanosensitive ion channel family protein [Cyanobium sp. PLM2.Bin73]|nr:MAG: mechanosensitive ion channel family protein [Cyanobium sp. PLM2.Bin73]